MNTETHTDAAMEELLEAEIPCIGPNSLRPNPCGRGANLMSRGHAGCPATVPLFKCITCWQSWYQRKARLLVENGSFGCSHCDQRFRSVESFSDYRPF